MSVMSDLRVFGWLVMTLVCLGAPALQAGQSPSDADLAGVDFDQKLGSQLNLELAFADEEGHLVRLGSFFGAKPVILVLGYYECPMLCTLVINGMVEALHDIKWSIGKEFEVVNVSIDPKEGPELAAAKKRAYLKAYRRPGAEHGWHFLTGREEAIRTLANEVGFNYLYDSASGQYAHPSGLVVLSPKGKVVAYQFGVAYQPAALLANLRQARTETPASPVQKIVLLCFHYNPIRGKYGPAIMLTVRLLALATLGALLALIALMLRPKAKSVKGAELHPASRGGPAP